MPTLTKVTHEHHARLHNFVVDLRELGDCLNADCLDTTRLIEGLPRMRELVSGLQTYLIAHMEAVEAAVYPTLERLRKDRETSAPMRREHEEIHRMVGALDDFVAPTPQGADRGSVLALHRVVLRLAMLLETHLAEEELYLPILEDQLTAGQEAALARALDHLAREPL